MAGDTGGIVGASRPAIGWGWCPAPLADAAGASSPGFLNALHPRGARAAAQAQGGLRWRARIHAAHLSATPAGPGPPRLHPPLTPPSTDEVQQKKLASISDTLKSHTRGIGPRIATGREGSLHHIYAPSSPRAQAAAYEQDELLHDMSDVGLKPTVVYHNLTPAELYEKVGGVEWSGAGRGAREMVDPWWWVVVAGCMWLVVRARGASEALLLGPRSTVSQGICGCLCLRGVAVGSLLASAGPVVRPQIVGACAQGLKMLLPFSHPPTAGPAVRPRHPHCVLRRPGHAVRRQDRPLPQVSQARGLLLLRRALHKPC